MQRTDIEYTSGQREVIPAQENNQTSESAAQFRKANVARKSGKSRLEYAGWEWIMTVRLILSPSSPPYFLTT